MHLIPQCPPRYPLGHRLHHGLVGLVGLVVSVVLIVDDLADWRVWISDFRTKVR